MVFDGFTKDTLAVLGGLERNNDKVWFDAIAPEVRVVLQANAVPAYMADGGAARLAPEINAVRKGDRAG